MRKIAAVLLTGVMMFGTVGAAEAAPKKSLPNLPPVESSYTVDPPVIMGGTKGTKISSYCRHKAPKGHKGSMGLECWIEVWAPNKKTPNPKDGEWRYIGSMDQNSGGTTVYAMPVAPLLGGVNEYRTVGTFWSSQKRAGKGEWEKVSQPAKFNRIIVIQKPRKKK